MPGKRWTADSIPDLAGRTAVVTGANVGLGYEIAYQLARHGAGVVMACRDRAKGEQALARLRSTLPGAAVELGVLDLADLASVRAFAGARGSRPLHVLVNNAGVMAIPYGRTADGFEMQLGTNHLGHFALTGLLLPALTSGGGARVVTMSSQAHRGGRIHFDDLQSERRYRRWAAYGQSKLANLLFSAELARRCGDTGIVSAAAHPGYAATELQVRGPQLAGSRVGERISRLGNRVLAQSAAQGALPALYAATMPDVFGGDYFGPDGRFEASGYPTRVGRSRAALDDGVARRLWEVSQDLTGVRYDALTPSP